MFPVDIIGNGFQSPVKQILSHQGKVLAQWIEEADS